MRRLILATLAVAAVGTLAAGCGRNNELNNQREKALNDRATAYARASAAIPAPKPVNFPLRKTLAVMTERDDLLNHPWYVYILGLNGNVIGYYVSQTDPVNACDFLSSTEDLHDGGIVTTAPSLDGIFYGGSGATAGCDAWVFLDAATDALVKIRGLSFYVADQPLRLNAKPITVVGK